MSAKQILTPRQREIITAVSRGLSSKEIATHIGISIGVVENHRNAIIKRLKCRNMFHAVGKFLTD